MFQLLQIVLLPFLEFWVLSSRKGKLNKNWINGMYTYMYTKITDLFSCLLCFKHVTSYNVITSKTKITRVCKTMYFRLFHRFLLVFVRHKKSQDTKHFERWLLHESLFQYNEKHRKTKTTLQCQTQRQLQRGNGGEKRNVYCTIHNTIYHSIKKA